MKRCSISKGNTIQVPEWPQLMGPLLIGRTSALVLAYLQADLHSFIISQGVEKGGGTGGEEGRWRQGGREQKVAVLLEKTEFTTATRD